MAKSLYVVYAQGEPDEAIAVQAYHPEYAACKFHEEVFQHWEFPEHLDLIVIDQAGERTYWSTTMEMTPSFYEEERDGFEADFHKDEKPVQKWLAELGAPLDA